MNTKKKIFTLAMMFVFVSSMLYGCGDSKKADAKPVSAPAVKERQVYVTPKWVKSVVDKNQEGYKDYVIAEVAYPEKASKDKDFGKGHIEGSIYVSNQEVEDATGSEEGAYNLLPAEKVKKNLLSHGITADTKVILYGKDVAGTARQAYAYIWCGVKDVKILDGGIEAWKKAGYDTVTGKPAKRKAAEDFGVSVPAHPEYYTSLADARQKMASDPNFKLVSIRSKKEWLGKTSGYDYIKRAGEPKGAVWGKGANTAFDVAQFVNKDGTIKSLDGFKKVWENCDFNLDNHLAFYCGTGWRACPPFLVLYQNGYNNISVYDGGWYEWQMHKDYPVQVGDPKSGNVKYTTVGELSTDKALKKKK
ncbi:sulfurtransferase [Mogibacterium sp.]